MCTRRMAKNQPQPQLGPHPTIRRPEKETRQNIAWLPAQGTSTQTSTTWRPVPRKNWSPVSLVGYLRSLSNTPILRSHTMRRYLQWLGVEDAPKTFICNCTVLLLVSLTLQLFSTDLNLPRPLGVFARAGNATKQRTEGMADHQTLFLRALVRADDGQGLAK